MGFFKPKSKAKPSSNSKSRPEAQIDSNESSTSTQSSNSSSSTTFSTPSGSRNPILQSSTSPTALTPPPTAMMHYANISTSNLSTTSTLCDQEVPLPQLHSQVQHHAAPSSYEIFLYEAQAAQAKAQEQRSRSWPHDPWRGGFGPPAEYVTPNPRTVLGKQERAIGEGGGLNPRREGGVKGWLGRNGLVRGG